jgi:hypothetical protein
MWRKMPRNQLAKCTEALSWRKAFPADYSGLVLEDPAQPDIIDGEVLDGPKPAKAQPRKAKGAERNRERAHRAAEQAEAPAEPAEPRRPAEERRNWSDSTRRKWLNRMFALFGDLGLKQDDDQAIAIAELGGLEALPEHRDGITDKALETVVHKAHALVEAAKAKDDPKAALEAAVDDLLRSWEYRQSGDNDNDNEDAGAEQTPADSDEAQA